ncbi:NUDIX hydrolase [Fredinandcohnia humi]
MIRQAVGAIVYQEDRFLVVHKTKINTTEGKQTIAGEWDFIKGGVEPTDEGLHSAILRELKEETGSEHFTVMEQLVEKLSFRFPEEIQRKIGYEHQETTMFLVRFDGPMSNIIPIDNEIEEYQFLTSDQVLEKLTHDDTRNYFSRLLKRDLHHMCRKSNLSKQST